MQEAKEEVWDLGTLGTKQVRLQREAHNGEKPLGAESRLGRMETLEETKREILGGNGGMREGNKEQ